MNNIFFYQRKIINNVQFDEKRVETIDIIVIRNVHYIVSTSTIVDLRIGLTHINKLIGFNSFVLLQFYQEYYNSRSKKITLELSIKRIGSV